MPLPAGDHQYRADLLQIEIVHNRTDRRTVTIDYRRQTPHHQSIDLQTPYTASSLVIETRQSEESTSASEARHVEGCPTYFAAVSERSLSLLARRRGHTIPKKERERARRHQAPSPHLQMACQLHQLQCRSVGINHTGTVYQAVWDKNLILCRDFHRMLFADIQGQCHIS
ncbi:hypothetical protein PGTUg99_033727 [Puccinia graminis f. sp. tritici]|uniref:Uncharacterized protein n=1 Tax=Puccinia graminis f. sp. tritici TaxID=56615 RepID=A0A5B0N1D8_PUCGR|nr:hypothetical protein PGTUg99_033727 [Puccinia graminis f. sp. tritici]